MKGTIKRGSNKEEDKKNKQFLYNDLKNRAENVMIVDLLRNDLGRISKTGSVKADKLFEIETHPTVFQMTSEISSELEENTSLYDIFKAIFPCGSITGAPKISTMKIIKELEKENRNIYCGAIGYCSPDECEFSVPIRILYGKDYCYTYHSGGAIVWDSDPEKEWEETLVKSKILETDFYLIETACDNWQSHVKRLKKSAKELGFSWNKKIEKLKISNPTRLTLSKNGDYTIEKKELPQIKNNKIIVKRKVNSKNKFLYHKTSLRNDYPKKVFEEIGINENNEITEGVFSNIAILKEGILYTPLVSSGILAGTFREQMIKKGIMKEKKLFLDDLKKAEKIYCFNSIRKMVEVELC